MALVLRSYLYQGANSLKGWFNVLLFLGWWWWWFCVESWTQGLKPARQMLFWAMTIPGLLINILNLLKITAGLTAFGVTDLQTRTSTEWRVPCLGKPDYSQGLMDILFKLSKWLNFWAFNWWKWIKEPDWQVWRSASVWSPTYFFRIDDMPSRVLHSIGAQGKSKSEKQRKQDSRG